MTTATANKSKRKADTAKARRLLVTNVTRGTVLGESVEIADTGGARSKGLLGRSGLAVGGGMWIVPCESVHTFWMKFPLDLIYIDRHHRVKKVRSNVPAWRMSGCLRAHSVIELPAGAIKRSQTQPGDTLSLSEREPA